MARKQHQDAGRARQLAMDDATDAPNTRLQIHLQLLSSSPRLRSSFVHLTILPACLALAFELAAALEIEKHDLVQHDRTL
jgi:hypothetical protein